MLRSGYQVATVRLPNKLWKFTESQNKWQTELFLRRRNIAEDSMTLPGTVAIPLQ